MKNRNIVHSLVANLRRAIVARRATFPLLLLTAGLVFVQPCSGQSGTWEPTRDLTFGRESHTATLLLNHKVLVVGGAGLSGILASAELYDPVSGTWRDTNYPLNTSRFLHTATLLPNGTVLVAGGAITPGGAVTKTAELYDLQTGRWSYTTDDLIVGRYHHTATLLSSGIVLAAGGIDTRLFATNTAELYAGSWVSTSHLNFEHYRHTATLLGNGTALVAGGCNRLLLGFPQSRNCMTRGPDLLDYGQPQYRTL